MKFALSGPNRDIGLRGPSRDPKFNIGTLRMAPQGESRLLQYELIVDLDDAEESFVYVPPLSSLLTSWIENDKGEIVGNFTSSGPAANKELSGGGRLYEAHQYGLKGIPFPSSLTPTGKDLTFKLVNKINPDVGVGLHELYFTVSGEDIWIPEIVTWLP